MDECAASKPRTPISKRVQVGVFRRDGWMCHWCGKPVVFAPAMKYLEKFVRNEGFTGTLAYHDARWRRDQAPLLDHLGAVIDHVEAHSRGGAAIADNFVTACNKCNTRKSNAPGQEFAKRVPAHRVRGKYGEPQHWDGLSTLFVLLVQRNLTESTSSDLDWFGALTPTLAAAASELRPTAVCSTKDLEAVVQDPDGSSTGPTAAPVRAKNITHKYSAVPRSQ